MSNAARFLLVLTSLALPGALTLRAATSAEPASVATYSAEQEALIAFAYSRFEEAGLSLPAVTIAFPSDRTECHGYGGIYEPDLAKVSICRPSDTTMVHELAHAWTESTLTAAERQDFIEMRGLDEWTDGSEWDQRGAEHAAEIMTWALMDRDISVRWIETDEHGKTLDARKLFKIPNSSPEELFSAFTQLTGQDADIRLAEQQPLEAATAPDEAVVSPEALRAGR